ncbi:hypothetical protein AAMO2058_000986000 [Amorphochlora amoebiformis]|uniref:Bifunctional lysine-specific demethylase and histidyl-hydroxylase n=1 Tax=Amorphochlora amoebiformis TaxID=1561963 RepID=A0A7S0CX55_9EUKA
MGKSGKRKPRAMTTFGENTARAKVGKKRKKKRKKGQNSRPVAVEEKSMGSRGPMPNFLCSTDPKRGEKFFAWLIHPITIPEFMNAHFEKKHLLIKRGYNVDEADDESKHYYHGWYSTTSIRSALENHAMHYGRDLDLTKFTGGQRKTVNQEGRAMGEAVWAKFSGGCSVRILRPQEYSDKVCGMLALMDEFWGRVSGANAYLTPSGTQGFAPHFDDVDVYILQLEGRKRWRLYPPRSPNDILPRFSSENLDPEELPEPILDTVLNPGDLLYAPRGTIHQAVALPGGPPSLHLTLSSGQRCTWTDYLSLLLPAAVQIAAESDPSFRESAPRRFGGYMGVVHSDKTDSDTGRQRAAFKKKVLSLVQKLLDDDHLPIDASVDQMYREFMHGRVPPLEFIVPELKMNRPKIPTERAKTDSSNDAKGELTATMQIRLVSDGCARLAMEGEAAVLYFCSTNSRNYKDKDENSLPFADHCAPALERILEAFPRYVRIGDLDSLSPEEQLIVANVLHENGVVVAKKG